MTRKTMKRNGLSTRECLIQWVVLTYLDLIIPYDIIKLICKPTLYDIVERRPKSKNNPCFYREQFIKQPSTTEYLVLRKVKVPLRFNDHDIHRSIDRVVMTRLISLLGYSVHHPHIWITKFIIPKNKYNILLTDDRNVPIKMTKSGCIKKESSIQISECNRLSQFNCNPVVNLCVNVHANISSYRAKSDAFAAENIHISFYIYDIVTIKNK